MTEKVPLTGANTELPVDRPLITRGVIKDDRVGEMVFTVLQNRIA